MIMVAVRWHLWYGLCYRDVEELLAERGFEVDDVTVFRWEQRFTPLLIDAARPCRHVPGDRWFVDETSCQDRRAVGLSVSGDQRARPGHRRAVSQKRDLAATRRFFTRALIPAPQPAEVTTDRASAYPRVLDE